MIDEMGTGRLRGRSRASRGLPALGLGGLFARRRFLGSGLRLRLPARENLDLAEAGDDELDRVALLADDRGVELALEHLDFGQPF